MTAAVGIVLDAVYNLLNLVYAFVVPIAPLSAIHWTEVTVGIGPLVPYSYIMVVQIFDICVTCNEPKQLVNYGFQMYLFCGDKRKAISQIETHLMSENADGSSACAVTFLNALVEYALK
jgi:hypothetical protein